MFHYKSEYRVIYRHLAITISESTKLCLANLISDSLKVGTKMCQTLPVIQDSVSFNSRYIVALSFLLVAIATWSEAKSSAKNHDLLTKIGFSRVRAPNSHHRKRLAVESRHHARSDDSHMFVIKLPPNQHYYAHTRPNTLDNTGRKIPLGFKSNGKPGKIYHWNMPVLKKMDSHRSKMRLNDAPYKFASSSSSSWNEVLDKPEQPVRPDYKKLSYYVPSKPKKSSFFKYFPGNGKPQAFYVIEKSKKQHYHRLLP